MLDVDIDVDEALILDLAREAAHNVERPAAPISTFLLGYAAARSDCNPEELDRLSTAATELALRWDKSETEVDHEDDDPEIDDELATADA